MSLRVNFIKNPDLFNKCLNPNMNFKYLNSALYVKKPLMQKTKSGFEIETGKTKQKNLHLKM